MTATPSLWTRIRRAFTRKPISHEEDRARQEAQVATARRTASFENSTRARATLNQNYYL